MLSIAIDRFKARYRMPAAALGAQPRVQRIVDDAITRVLEGAIEREGIGRSGYVCVRDVQAVATLRLREPDSALAFGVGEAIAIAIRKSIEEGSSSVVQYGSRAHALIDLASSATAGEFGRSWAWTQIGIWRSDFPLRADVTADLVVRGLAKEPTHAAAVVAYLARERADRLRTLISHATPNAWSALAQAAISAAGGSVGWTTRVSAAARDARDPIDPERREDQAMAPLALRVARHSAIARVATGLVANAPAEILSALVALALLEVEPSAAHGQGIPRLLMRIEQAMSLPTMTTAVRLPAAEEREAATVDAREALGVTGRSDEEAVRLEGAPSADASDPLSIDPRHSCASHDGDRRGGPGVQDRSTTGRHATRADNGDALRADAGKSPRLGDGPGSRVDGESAGRAPTTDRANREGASRDSDRAADGVPEVGGLTATRHGGLLYLVNLLPRIGLVEMIHGDDRWADRGLRWVLHQLAMALAAIDPDDPAALVFAGLMPGAPPPSTLQDPPTGLEGAAVEVLRAAISGALRDALGGPAETDGESDRQVMDRVCHRPAQIRAEPGWIEARFSLEDVSLEIRRAGLDRDPEWVPWLGIVLRFMYV